MKTTVVLALMMVCVDAFASFPDQLPAQQFYEESSSVLYGQITSGELIVRGAHTCGAKYMINVLRQFKGENGASLEVMDGPGVSDPKIGGKYLFFLSERNGRQLDNLVGYQDLPKDWLEACSTTSREIFQTLRLEENFNATT